jgi:hypothetical protein
VNGVPVSTTPSSLFGPLDVRAILVPNEVVHYAERQHWASVAQPVYEAFLFVMFVIWMVSLADGDPGTSLLERIVFLLLAGAAAHIGLMILNGNQPGSRLIVDPFTTRRGGPSRFARWVGVAIVAYLLWQLGIYGGGVVGVTLVIGRLVMILAQWAFYERRYITDRRLIESGGFLRSRIDSMPLTRVTDISFSRTIPAEVLGYATMRIETAGQDQALGTVRYITDPGLFYKTLISLSAPPAPGAPPSATQGT